MGRRPRKSRESGYAPGMIVPFLTAPKANLDEDILGMGMLIEKVDDASVLDCHVLPEEEQKSITRSLEPWTLEIVSLSPKGESWNFKVGDIIERKLTMVYGGRKTPSGATSLRHVAGEITTRTEFIDKFIEVDGVEIF
jgi:hypothetical protein